MAVEGGGGGGGMSARASRFGCFAKSGDVIIEQKPLIARPRFDCFAESGDVTIEQKPFIAPSRTPVLV